MDKIRETELKIKKLKALADGAKRNGMHSTYSKYLFEISLLNKKLRILQTGSK